jgi:hypothetical protein
LTRRVVNSSCCFASTLRCPVQFAPYLLLIFPGCHLANFARAVRGPSYLPRPYHAAMLAPGHRAFDVFEPTYIA